MLSRRGRALLVTGLAMMRLGELAWSARNRRRAGAGEAAAPRSYPLMVGANAALFVLCLRRALARAEEREGGSPPSPGPALQGAALGGLAGAVLLRLWVIRSLGPAWNVRAVVPEAMAIVRRGPYRWVRHPNYVAVALEFACLPLVVGARAEAALLSLANAAVLVPRIRGEERLLDRVPGYRQAFRGVPRFVPQWRPRRPGACFWRAAGPRPAVPASPAVPDRLPARTIRDGMRAPADAGAGLIRNDREART